MLEPCRTPDMWTLSVEDFRARTSALQEKGLELQAKDPASGVKCIGLYGTLDPATSSLKTAQLCFFGDLNESYATFPKAGTMRNGNVFQTSLLDTPICVRGYTLLPTPTKSDSKACLAKMESLKRYLNAGHQKRIMDILSLKGFTKCQKLTILELAMGFGIGYTALEASETPSIPM